MAGGGRRAGAGRKKNPKLDDLLRSYLTRAEKRTSPLQIMTSCARAAYALAMRDPNKLDMDMLKLAQDWSKDCANYYHPKLVSQEVSGKGGGPLEMVMKSTVQVYLPDNHRRVIDVTPPKQLDEPKPAQHPNEEEPDADETLPPEPRKRDDEEQQEPERERAPMREPEAATA